MYGPLGLTSLERTARWAGTRTCGTQSTQRSNNQRTSAPTHCSARSRTEAARTHPSLCMDIRVATPRLPVASTSPGRSWARQPRHPELSHVSILRTWESIRKSSVAAADATRSEATSTASSNRGERGATITIQSGRCTRSTGGHSPVDHPIPSESWPAGLSGATDTRRFGRHLTRQECRFFRAAARSFRSRPTPGAQQPVWARLLRPGAAAKLS
jgi:hypothetical protein